jgi:hypothetical protein
MPSTYSSLLRLEMMAVGEKTNTWGTIANTNLGTLLEKSIAGAASIDVTAANVTLTSTNGADDEARCAILLVTGTPGTSRNIVAPSSSKAYYVVNGSNASVVLKGTATAGLTILAGTQVQALWNGSDFVGVGLVSPTFTGTPTAPTAAVDTNTTQLATTAYVIGQGYLKSATASSTYAPIANPTLTGVPAGPTAAVDTATTQLATTAYVVNQGYTKTATLGATYALINSPTFTGVPAAPTAAVDTNTTQLATTQYVIGQGYLKSATAASTYATLANAALTGTPTHGGIEIGYRRVPAASVTTGSVVAADSGKCVYATAGVTIPNGVFQQGDVLTIYNNTASSITITASISTLRLAGTATTGNRTLAQRGIATVLFNSGTDAAITGSGLA